MQHIIVWSQIRCVMHVVVCFVVTGEGVSFFDTYEALSDKQSVSLCK